MAYLNQYGGQGNPYSGSNPYLIQKDNSEKKQIGSTLMSVATMLSLMKKNRGEDIVAPESGSVTKPNLGAFTDEGTDLSAFQFTDKGDMIGADNGDMLKFNFTDEGTDLSAFQFTDEGDMIGADNGDMLKFNFTDEGDTIYDGSGTEESGGGSSGGGASLGVILAAIKGAFMNKDRASDNIKYGRNDTTAFERYYNRGSEHPVTSALNPTQAFVDLELISEDNEFGQFFGNLGRWEKNIMDPIQNYCIIVSACTGRDSYEVNVTRKFRDRYMDEETLTGYYAMCVFVVPFIMKYPWFKRIVKKVLVDRLVDYGEWKLEMKPDRKYLTSGAVTKMFLGLCRHIGKGVDTVLAGQEV